MVAPALANYMRHLLPILILTLVLGSCGSKKRTYSATRNPEVVADSVPVIVNSDPEVKEDAAVVASTSKIDAVIKTALTFAGVRYRYGGTTRKGMDCSGLLYTSFLEHDLPLPRTSKLMAEEGRKIGEGKIRKGDLLFFKTGRRNNKINHVGMVVDVDGNEIKFIHSTTSRGVIVSSLDEGYWNYAFVKATRIF